MLVQPGLDGLGAELGKVSVGQVHMGSVERKSVDAEGIEKAVAPAAGRPAAHGSGEFGMMIAVRHLRAARAALGQAKKA